MSISGERVDRLCVNCSIITLTSHLIHSWYVSILESTIFVLTVFILLMNYLELVIECKDSTILSTALSLSTGSLFVFHLFPFFVATTVFYVIVKPFDERDPLALPITIIQ